KKAAKNHDSLALLVHSNGSSSQSHANSSYSPQPYNAETVPSYDANATGKVNASSKVHEQVSHVKCKTIIQTYDDQIDSNIIFDDPYVENNGGTFEHDSYAHDEYHEI
ncbi:hypothetical protein Tco_1468267, partial [Tanacetum coccineum]